jgi:hypothetical protein
MAKIRGSSSAHASAIKEAGHKRESEFAQLIGGDAQPGTGKTDVIDQAQNTYSVKSGKKWQIFLYSLSKIEESTELKFLLPCLNAFPQEAESYFRDRDECLSKKIELLSQNGMTKAEADQELVQSLPMNLYICSKMRLGRGTEEARAFLSDKSNLRAFLAKSIFNNEEVTYLAIKELGKIGRFHVFHREDILKILVEILIPYCSKAGVASKDFNIEGQKTILKFRKGKREKNLIEIEIRNDSDIHYRQVRFNMYASDALSVLVERLKDNQRQISSSVLSYGRAAELLEPLTRQKAS